MRRDWIAGSSPAMTLLFLSLPLHHHLLDFRDGLCRVQSLGAGFRAIHDGVAAVEAERVFEVVEAFAGGLVAAVYQPAIGLQQRGGAEIAVAVPPVGRSRRRAAGAEDALVEPVELPAVLIALAPFPFRRRRLRLQPGLSEGVLRVEFG